MSTGLLRVVERARREPEGRFHSLAHLIDVPALERAFHRLRGDAAVGVDGVSKEDYGQELDENLVELHGRMKAKRYRHQPLRRVHIPKGDGRTRPIGISAVEDKIVQGAVREVLEAVYEQDFLECSYGFRPGRGAHDAIRALNRAVYQGKVRWILEADIESFFDSLDRTRLEEMLRIRVVDGSLRRLVGKCVRVGVLDGEERTQPERGTPQGSGLSALLGNLYLHHTLDVWFEREVKPRLGGEAVLVRYCDDFVIGFERREDAQRVAEVLGKRMERYGLRLHPEKTRLIAFERPKAGQREPNLSTQGIAVVANTLELDGGTIRSGGNDANLAHDGLGHDANHKVDWQTAGEESGGGGDGPGGLSGDSGPPSVTGVSVVSSPASNATYLLGEKISIRVAFDQAVSVTGSPQLSIDMDPAAWGTKQAAYESGGGTSSLTFVHMVVEPNYSTQGIAVLANTLALNGGTIRSTTGANAALGHTGLGHNAGHKVDWRPAISVADARADEGAGASVAFEVSLSRAFTNSGHSVTVDYATADGSAKAGEDYTATSGTLTFAAGEKTKTVNVPVLDDAVDEGEETFTFRLSNATGGRIGDGEATGTIANDDPLQKMWLSRFGRTVASHVTDAVSDRLANPLSGAQMTVGGQRVDLAATEDSEAVAQALAGFARALGARDAPGPGREEAPGGWLGERGAGWNDAAAASAPRRMTGRELLLGSAFHLAREGDGGDPSLAAWGRVTVGGFDGEAPADDGNVRIDGDVTTGILGADAEWNRLLAGVAVSLSEGEGTFAQPGVDSGTIESSLTTVSPYARLRLSERVSAWGLVGFGTGDMTIVQDANDRGQSERVIRRTDIEMRMGAVGGRGALLEADETGGIDLALKADAFYVETEAEAVSNEGNTTADASRVRLALEGSRSFETGGGTLTPGLELGVRHDDGDAETGTGVELGGRLSWADADSGLSMEARVRTLVAHEDSGYEEWGASGAVRLDPGASGRGLSFSVAPTWGVASSGVDRLWSARDAQGLAPDGEFEPERRLDAELGYGLAAFGGRFTGTPNLGLGLSDGVREMRIGWRLTPAAQDRSGFELNLDAIRRESAGDDEAPEHGVMLRGAIRW